MKVIHCSSCCVYVQYAMVSISIVSSDLSFCISQISTHVSYTFRCFITAILDMCELYYWSTTYVAILSPIIKVTRHSIISLLKCLMARVLAVSISHYLTK